MPGVLITGPTAVQNSPFCPQRLPKPLPVLIATNHGGIARLSGQWPGKRRDGRPVKGGHQSQY